MMVPTRMIKRDEAYISLCQSPCHQAIVRIGSWLPCLLSIELISRFCSSDRSANSRTGVRIRSAISYCAMRASTAGSPLEANSCSFRALTTSRILRLSPMGFCVGSFRYNTGSAPERSRTPAKRDDRKPLPQSDYSTVAYCRGHHVTPAQQNQAVHDSSYPNHH